MVCLPHVLQECEIPIMIIECCSQEKTFVRYYALLGSRFCMVRKEFQVSVVEGVTGRAGRLPTRLTPRPKDLLGWLVCGTYNGSVSSPTT